MFNKVLIANRGEIAVRIIRTCRDMGIATVALYEESDYGSLHVLLADECVRIDSARRYTDIDRIIELASSRQVDAVHPGYGFLAESSEFAAACEAANLNFIGPSAKTLSRCSSKLSLLQTAQELDIPVPEHSGKEFEPEEREALEESAGKLGYPLMVKSVAGRNIRAVRLAHNQEELHSCTLRTSQEGQLLFGDKRVYLERALSVSRTILMPFICFPASEPQILGTIDASLQRHNTRILCESPAPAVEKKSEMEAAAKKLVKDLDYRGLGTVEFLLEPGGSFFFIGMQARIQIEHPVIELLLGIDLVQEQLRVAAKDGLGFEPRQERGYAMLCRIHAEDILRMNLPSPGVLTRFRLPGGPHVRVDAFGYGGCRIPQHFEPLLATVACWGETRDECLRRMRRSLRDTAITGVKTNLARIQALLHEDAFVAGEYDCNTAIKMNRISFASQSNVPLAAIAAIVYTMRDQARTELKPERFSSQWHSSMRASFAE